jgi:hypothetical protein
MVKVKIRAGVKVRVFRKGCPKDPGFHWAYFHRH